MYDELKKHDEEILELKDATAANQKAILELKKNEEKQDKEILELKNSYINLENTIMKENRETRISYQLQTDRQWQFIERVTGYKESEAERKQESEEAEKQRKHDLKVQKYNHIAGFLLKVSTVGGIAYLLIQDWLLTK